MRSLGPIGPHWEPDGASYGAPWRPGPYVGPSALGPPLTSSKYGMDRKIQWLQTFARASLPSTRPMGRPTGSFSPI